MKLTLIQGDITKLEVDVIVNAANSSLMGGGGVDGAIHQAGGKEILEDCRKIRARQGRCYTGQAVYTTAGNLNAEYVIHTVGPVWNGGFNDERQLLANCYENSLRLAKELGAKTVAFPNISTGIYHFPKELAAKIAIKKVKDNPLVEEVIFCCYDEENLQIYEELMKE